jgi:soluble lytic murein transglycosylase
MLPSRAMRLRRGFLLAAIALGIAGAAAAVLLSHRRTRWDDAAHPPPPFRRALDDFAAGRTDAGVAAVRKGLETYRAPAWESRIRVAAAVRLVAADQRKRVVEVLPADLPASDPLAGHADVLRARSLLAAGKKEEAARAAARAARIAGHPWKQEAIRLQASALEADGSVRAALGVLDAARDPSLAFEAARVAQRAGDVEAARRRLAAIVLEAPAGVEAERALDALEDLVPKPEARFSAQERSRLQDVADRWAADGRPARSLDLLRSARPAGAASSPDACVAEADLELRLGKVPACATLLARLARTPGESGDAARYLDARAREAAGRPGYRAGLETLARQPGASPWRLHALLDLAELAEGAPSPQALAAYRRYREAAGAKADPTALWREAWIAHELSRSAEADLGIERVLARDDAPDSVRMAALYWSGRRLESAGQRDRAAERYRRAADRLPGHYYGLLAASRLGVAASARPGPPERAPAPRRGSSAESLLSAARALLSVGLTDLAIDAYRAAASADEVARREISLEGAAAALEAGAAADAIELVQSGTGGRDGVRPGELPLRYLRLLVPAPSAKDIVAAARESRLEPHLVASIALEESAFNPLAVSPVGARGLLQVMPATGAELARGMGIRPFDSQRLYEPALNLRLGCAYFRRLVDQLGGVPPALAAYNAGATRAKRWEAPGDDADPERYVERIPVPVTRSYVKRILANVRLYRIAWPDGLDSKTP